MRLAPAPVLALFLLLGGCDPGVHFGWEKEFDGRVDAQCVERALKSVSPDVGRGTYVSNGDRGFPSGTEVTQFYYSDPVTHSGYTLDLVLLTNGKTRYVHEWAKVGTEIPTEEQAKVSPLLYRANNAVERLCGLSFEGSQPQVGPG